MATLSDLPSEVVSRAMAELHDKLPLEVEVELVELASTGKVLDAKAIAALVTRHADSTPTNGD